MCLPYPYRRSNPISPSQCPYKSPQAHAFRIALSSVIQLCHKSYTGESLWSRWESKPINLVIFVMITWTKKTWTEFDMAWLQLRHQFMHRYGLDKGRFLRSLSEIDDDPPIFDLAQALTANTSNQGTNTIKKSLSAVRYHCFSEVSKWVTDRGSEDIYLYGEPLQAIVQTNEYLRDIMLLNEDNGFISFTNFCNIATHVKSRDKLRTFRFALILHQENMAFFLQSQNGSSKGFDVGLRNHKLELTMRFSTVIYNDEYKHSSTAILPVSLFGMFRVEGDMDNDSFLWQWVNQFSTFFQHAIGVQMPYKPRGTLQTFQEIPDLIWNFAFVSLESIFSLNEGLRPAIQGKFLDTFRMITENLNEQMSSPNFQEPDLLFYLTGLYLRAMKIRYRTYHICLDDLLSAMWIYKEKTIDAGILNSDLEEIYGRETGVYQGRFSSEWWKSLDSGGV
ncbi:hypothetical protein GALMADRAFT_872998 [Galerina marginata CBS 339.88]|uniref:Uncharacterized protein n=1 Tax=Galerina marginata (strain CBS 339.88) TaxID=685588 RepID=A0A067TJ22_GALM3|nr:hypothetical protein GALMADRAFT_872998 [Galerina marginata CBS 339.88]